MLFRSQQGAGDTKTPFWLTLFSMWILRVPLAAYLALGTLSMGTVTLNFGLEMGADGCWLSLAITQFVQGILAMILWQKGRWKEADI